ncbi:MAG: hypothetical protein KA436_11240 [Oligoflexales bacterium]|nr:hypothetical protein [Oligoflexales bacterium]
MHEKSPFLNSLGLAKRAPLLALFFMTPLIILLTLNSSCQKDSTKQKTESPTALAVMGKTCSPKQGLTDGGATDPSCSVGSESSNTNKAPESSEDDGEDKPPPGFATAKIGAKFNTVKTTSFKTPAEDKLKVFILQRIAVYRPVWLDATAASWGVFPDASGLGQMFPAKEVDKHEAKNISIHQPLAGAATVNHERGDEFFGIGHALSLGIRYPECPTAVLSLYAGKKPEALAPPKNYSRIYFKQGTNEKIYADRCMKMQKEQTIAAKNKENSSFPDPVDQEMCAIVQAGTTLKTDLDSLMYGGSEAAYKKYFEKQNVAIWDPIPQPGYKCLGQIVTNTKEKPLLASDNSGENSVQREVSIGTVQGSSQGAFYESATYCVKEEYVTDGVVIPILVDQDIAIGIITAKDPNVGFSSAKLFAAYKKERPDMTTEETANKLREMKVWVLKKDSIKVLPDLLDKDNPNQKTCDFIQN